MWGHPTAYMDEVICTWHSQLVSKECTQALLSQDCFAGELTPTVIAGKFLRQQAQHVIGPHITGRVQLTDTTFVAGAKQAWGALQRQDQEAPEAQGLGAASAS